MKKTLVSEKNYVIITYFSLFAIGSLLVYLSTFTPGVSSLLIAIFVGMIIRNVLPSKIVQSIPYSSPSKKILRIGIVFLGFKLSIFSIFEIGMTGFAIIFVAVLVTFFGTIFFGRLLNISRELTTLIATGFSICGASAVAAMSSVVHNKSVNEEEETAQAITLVTIYGTVAMFLLPYLSNIFHLTDTQSGLWFGASIHEVAQVVAAGGMVSTVALALATIAKLSRVVLLAPLVASVGLHRSRVAKTESDDNKQKAPIIPLFVIGFLVAILLRTFIGFSDQTLFGLNLFTEIALSAAMFGLGFGIEIKKLFTSSWKPLMLGGIATLLITSTSLILILVFNFN